MTDVLVDCMVTARRVLASPDGVYTLTPHEAVALAACTVRESTGKMPELPRVIEAGPVLSASLASAIAAALVAFDRADRQCSGFGIREAENALAAALNTLRTHFEKEFPHGSA